MAEKLIGAFAKGAYKATTDPVKSAAKQAFDPNIMRTVYRAGIIGPLIKSIVSEYKKGDGKKDKQAPVVMDVSKGLQTLNSQISSLTSIMADIRELTQNQLQLQKDIFTKNQRDARKASLEAVEEKIEKPSKAPLSQLPGAEIKPKAISALKGIADFVKDNPLLSLIIGGVFAATSESVRKAIGDFVEGADLERITAVNMEKLKGVVSNGIGKITENMGFALGKNVDDMIASGFLTGLLFRILRMRFRTGFFAGAGIEASRQQSGNSGVKPKLDENGNPILDKNGNPIEDAESFLSSNSITSGILHIVGGALAWWLGGKVLDKASGGVKKGYGALRDKIFGKPQTPPGSIKGPPVAGTPSTPKPSPIIIPSEHDRDKYGRGKRDRSGIERERAAARATNPNIEENKRSYKVLSQKWDKLVARVGRRRAFFMVAQRLGVSAVGLLVPGPGWLWFLVSLAGTVYTAIEILDTLSREVEEEKNNPTFEDVEALDMNDIAAQMAGGTPSPSIAPPAPPPRPSMSSLTPQEPVQSNFNFEEYRKRIMLLESSGGQNVPNAMGSSAFGKYQVMPETFAGLQERDPSLRGITFDQFKKDTSIQDRVFKSLTESNAAYLQNNGITPNAFNLYLAHRLGGPKALRLLKADPGTGLIQALYGPEGFKSMSIAASQNPDMRNKTVGQWTQERMAAFGPGNLGAMKENRLTRDSTVPGKDSYEQLETMRALRAMKERSITVIQQQTTSAEGGSSSENKRAQPAATMPYSRTMEQERSLFFGRDLSNLVAP